MKRSRYSTEKKIWVLREAWGSAQTIEDVCRPHLISDQTPDSKNIWQTNPELIMPLP